MSDTKWTPGPWRLGDVDDSVIKDGMTDIHADSHGALASAVTRMTEYDEADLWQVRKRAELVANARLIAASPSLYSACETALIALFNGFDKDNFSAPEQREAIRKLRAAMKQARCETTGDKE